MPLALDPSAKFEVFLSSDANTPQDERPTFFLRYLPASEWVEQAKVNDQISGKTKTLIKQTSSVIMKRVINAVNMSVIGWTNIKDSEGKTIKYSAEKLSEILTAGELVELLLLAVNQRSMTEPESDEQESDDKD